MKANPITPNFSTGEVTPRLAARVDLTRYTSSLRKLQNFIIMPQGGVTRRPGTYFVASTKNPTQQSRLVRFEFSVLQAYILEFGHLYCRFYRNESRIESSPGVPYEIVTPYTESQLFEINFIQSADILFLVHPSHRPAQLSRTGHTSWTLANISVLDGPYLSENTGATTLTSASATGSGVAVAASSTAGINNGVGFVASDVGRTLRIRNDGGTIFSSTGAIDTVRDAGAGGAGFVGFDGIVAFQKNDHGLSTGQAITISGDATPAYTVNGVWTITALNLDWCLLQGSTTRKLVTACVTGSPNIRMTIDNHGYTSAQQVRVAGLTGVTGWSSTTTYNLIIVDINTVELSGTTFGGTFTPGPTSLCRVVSVFNSAGEYETSGLVGWGTIATVVNSTNITLNIAGAVPATASRNWRLGAWSSALGYPSVLCFFEQRLVFANSVSQPQTFWMSNSAEFNNFGPTNAEGVVGDANAITYTIAADSVNSIVWLNPGRTLLVGTAAAEWEIGDFDSSEAISATNIKVKRHTAWGSRSGVSSVRAGSSVLFAQRTGRALREMTYSFQINGYESQDISLLSEHFFRRHPIKEIVHAPEPFRLLWIITTTGKLVAVTYIKEQETIGFQGHLLGGANVFVESIQVIPSPTTDYDQVWMIVRRTIGEATTRYVEFLTQPFSPEDENDKNDAFFVDCGLTYDGVETSTITGLNHLIGQTVSLLSEGSVQPNAIVNNAGQITLQHPTTYLHVGLPSLAALSTLPFDVGASFGTAHGQVQRIHAINIELHETMGGKQGPNYEVQDYILEREDYMPMDDSPPLYTGIQPCPFEGDYGTREVIVITQDQPLPITILGIMPEMITNDS